MLNNITWQGYWITIALLTIAYYLSIYLLYFRKDFSISFRRSNGHRVHSKSGLENETILSSELPVSAFSLQDEEEGILNTCIDEINAFFEGQKKSKAVKGEVVYALHRILQKYPSLKASANHEAISKMIQVQCENICSISLQNEEMKGVWYG